MGKNRNMKRFKQGAASFYMVAITTLVLVIIATSFAAVIIAEIARTSNDDLAQSAYDAAMAGVEDARLAYYNYSNCIEKGGSECGQYLGTSDECNSFVNALGRVAGENGEVKIQESSDNNMDQAYTCVKISKPDNVVGRLDKDSPTEIIKVELGEGESAEEIKSVKLSWNKASGEGNLPMLEIGLTQTKTGGFNMSEFEMTKGAQTNRGAVFLDSKFNDEGVNEIGAEAGEGFLKSNDKVASNEPYKIKCDDGNEYGCTVDIKLPEAVGGGRNNDTFMFTLAMLGENTDGVEWKMELCKSDEGCHKQAVSEDGNVTEEGETAKLDMQIAVDATGRANDLYRRVEVRLGKADTTSPNKIYAVEADSIKKIEYAICENDFGASNCND